MKKTVLGFSFLASFLLLTVSASVARADADAAKGKELYDSKCAKCHGKSGAGDGKSARALNTKPTAFNEAKPFTDKKDLDMTPEARMAKAIKEGGQAVKESKEMDAYPDFTEQQIQDLLAYIKTLSK